MYLLKKYFQKIILEFSIIYIMGIGDWAQSPIPNPQSPFLTKLRFLIQKNAKIK